jgi:DNA-binding MarR family transcriptional regulator
MNKLKDLTDEDCLNILKMKQLRMLYAIWYKRKMNIKNEKERIKAKHRVNNMLSLSIEDIAEEISLLDLA